MIQSPKTFLSVNYADTGATSVKMSMNDAKICVNYAKTMHRNMPNVQG